jgi:O-antigen ligase/tetratricopeptide (TPR) repeat protein
MEAEMAINSPQPINSTRRQQWRELIILLLLVYNTFVGGSTYGLLVFYPRLVTQILYFSVIALWLISLLRERRPFPHSPLDLPLLVLGGLILGATIFSAEPRLSLDDIPLYFAYVMLYYMVIDRLRAGWRASAFLKGLVMTMVVVCAFAGFEYLAWYIGLPLFPAFKQGWWPIGGAQNPIPPYWYRLSYTLNNANILSSLLALVLPIGVAVAITTRSSWTRINAIAWALVNALVLWLTFSRGGLLAAAVGLAVLGFIAVKRKGGMLWSAERLAYKHRLMLLVGGGSSVVALLIAVLSTQELNRVEGYSIRLALWRYALQIIRDHPLIGTGPRTFGMVVTHYWDPTQYPTSYIYGTAHNVLLQAGAEIGIPATLAIALICWLIIRGGLRQCNQPSFKQPILMAGVLSGLVAFGAQSVVDNLMAVPAVVMPIIVMAAICTAQIDDTQPPANSFLTPKRGVLLTAIVAALAAWSLSSQASFGNIAADAQAEHWPSAAKRLDDLPVGTLSASLYDFQRGLAYGKIALGDPASGMLQAAIARYQEGLAKVPDYVPGHANLAALYWQGGDISHARQELQVAIAHEPGEFLYQLNLALLEEQQGNDAAAAAAYGKILAANPSLADSTYWQENDWRRQHWPLMRSQAEALIQRASAPDAAGIYRGELAYFSGDLERAAELFRSGMTETGSFDDDIWLSWVWMDQGRFREAADILDRVIEAAPAGNAWAYTGRGRANLALGRKDAAAHDLEIALFLGDDRAQYYLAQLALAKGDVDTAISLYRRSLSAPGSLASLNLRYDFLFYRQGGIYESNLLPQAIFPPSKVVADTYLALADLYAAQGNIKAARQVCQQLMTLSPGYKPAQDKLDALVNGIP